MSEDYSKAEKLYMKLDVSVGGYLALTTKPCEIKYPTKELEEKYKNYEYKAELENGKGEQRNACWYLAGNSPNPKMTPNVLVIEEIETETNINYNLGVIAQYYFKPTKE